ncbi:MAG: hypothetical protein N2C14_10820, partial [Planctomycetales bacterium]
MNWKPIRYLLEYFCVRVFVCVIQAAPMDLCKLWADLLGSFCADVLGIRRKITMDNLRHAFPELNDRQLRGIARGMWRHLLLMVMEIARTHRTVHRATWRQYVKLTGH